MKRLTAKRVARYMWQRDGEPDGRGEGEANRNTYQWQAIDVMAAIRALGFKVVPRNAKLQPRAGELQEHDQPHKKGAK